MAKRALDLLLAIVGLIIVSPLMILVALVIWLEDRDEVIFRQVRVGRGGKPFEILKFRTMRTAPDGTGPLVTAGDDPRITRAGKFLRSCKLDELPQLWNVIRGDMSLVGPRPEVPKYVQYYPEPLRTRVLSIRPGITDYASLEFRNESELLQQAADRERYYVEDILPKKLALYEKYLSRQSVLTDLSLILRTAAQLITRR